MLTTAQLLALFLSYPSACSASRFLTAVFVGGVLYRRVGENWIKVNSK